MLSSLRIVFGAILLALSLSSCGDFTEEVWIDANGGGRQEYQMDLGQLYPFIGMALQEGKFQTDRPDTLSEKDLMAYNMARFLSREKVDTVISLRPIFEQLAAKEGLTLDDMLDQLNNSPEMSESQSKLINRLMNVLLAMEFRIKADQEKAKFDFALISRFAHLDETFTASITSLMAEMKEELGDELPPGIGNIEDMMGAYVRYELDGKTLHVRRKAMPDMAKTIGDQGAEGAQALEMMNMAKGFMANVNYRVVLHLPGKVAKVRGGEAEIDGNTVTLSIPYADLYDPEKEWDFAIRFR